MAVSLVRFINVVLIGLLAGTMFGIWIGFNPVDLSPPAYIEHQQNMIRQLNTLMPLLGAFTILLTLTSAVLQRRSRVTATGLLIAVIFLIASGLITRFGNQPINSIVQEWDAASPPDNWIALRDQWWLLHIIRTIAALIALCLVVWMNLIQSKVSTAAYKGKKELVGQ